MKNSFLLPVFLLLFGGSAYADSSSDFSGFVGLRQTQLELQSTLANPDVEIIPLERSTFHLEPRLYGNIALNGTTRLHLKTRPRMAWDSRETRTDLLLDDAYLEILVDSRTLVVGKQNFPAGFGLGFNPTRFWDDIQDQDFTKSFEDRQSDQEGAYFLQWDSFYPSALFGIGLVIPTSREKGSVVALHPKFSHSFKNVSISTHAFIHNNFGLGINANGLLLDKMSWHLEFASQKGNDLQRPIQSSARSPEGNALITLIRQNSESLHTDALVGARFKWLNGYLETSMEYIYRQTGFDMDEWQSLIGILEQNQSVFSSGSQTERALAANNILQVHQILRQRYIRKHYLYSRHVFQPPRLSHLELELGSIQNFGDGSYALLPAINYRITESLEARIHAQLFYGSPSSQFGLNVWKTLTSLELRAYF